VDEIETNYPRSDFSDLLYYLDTEMMKVDEYFEFMRKVVHGTKYVDLQYENQFGRRYKFQGKGYECPNCKVGFNAVKSGEIVCPICEHEFQAI